MTLRASIQTYTVMHAEVLKAASGCMSGTRVNFYSLYNIKLDLNRLSALFSVCTVHLYKNNARSKTNQNARS